MFKKTTPKLEEEFLKAARAAARTPGHENRKRAAEAHAKLPSHSKLKGTKFPGPRKSWTV